MRYYSKILSPSSADGSTAISKKKKYTKNASACIKTDTYTKTRTVLPPMARRRPIFYYYYYYEPFAAII